MAKRRFSIVVPLPAYARPRNEWRRRVHAAVLEALARRLTLALDRGALSVHAIDDRVKDVIDALGGRIAGPRSERRIAPIVEDDQIARIVLEKAGVRRRGRTLG